MWKSFAFFVALGTLGASLRAQPSPLIDDDFGVRKIAGGCLFTEGPAVAADGALYFSDQPNDRILRWTSKEGVSVLLSPCGAANGLSFDGQGNLLMCQSARKGGARAVAKYNFDHKRLTTVTSRFEGRRYIAPNDVCVDHYGRIFFTDPHYDGDKSQPTSGVYRIEPNGEVTLVVSNLLKPNGIVITPDAKSVYISDRGTQKLHRFHIELDGTLTPHGILYDFSPDRGIDGMCLDQQGNVYGAAGQGETTGLYVISPQGILLHHQRMPEFSTNVAFGGEDRKDLFLTATTSVYRMRATIPGALLPHLQAAAIFASVMPAKVLDRGAGEGPAWHPEFGLIFSGDGGINQLEKDGTVSLFESDAGTNGLLFDVKGRMLRCQPRDRRVSRLNRDGRLQVLTETFENAPYNQPNDITVDSHRRIYFSDPKYGDRTELKQLDADGNPIEGVYRIDPDGTVTRIITHEADRPNGVLVSLDDRYLFVSDNNNNQVGGARSLYRFDLREDGSIDPASRKALHSWGTGRGPDGMAQDVEGRLYVAAGRNEPVLPFETADVTNRGGVYVIDPVAGLLAFVPIERDEVTNCAFGDEDLHSLYITAGGSLWKLRTKARGSLPWKR